MMVVTHRHRISNSVRKDLYIRLQKVSAETRIPISKLLDEAIELVLKEHEHTKKDTR